MCVPRSHLNRLMSQQVLRSHLIHSLHDQSNWLASHLGRIKAEMEIEDHSNRRHDLRELGFGDFIMDTRDILGYNTINELRYQAKVSFLRDKWRMSD